MSGQYIARIRQYASAIGTSALDDGLNFFVEIWHFFVKNSNKTQGPFFDYMLIIFIGGLSSNANLNCVEAVIYVLINSCPEIIY